MPILLDIVRRSIPANTANVVKAAHYAYQQYDVQRELNANGRETDRQSETWDVIALEGSTYRKLILRNDKPLAAKEQKKEDERLRRETERRKKESADAAGAVGVRD